MTIPTSGAVSLDRVRQEFTAFSGLIGVAAPRTTLVSSRYLVTYLVGLQSSFLASGEGLQIRNADATTFIALFKDSHGDILPPNVWKNGGSTGANINMYDELALWRGMYLVWRRWNGLVYYDGATTA